jgi:hypothetical protein
MNTYEIELKRTSYVTLVIKADSKDQAEQIAWDDIDSRDASYEINYIKETE